MGDEATVTERAVSLTNRQRAILDMVRARTRHVGYPPSVREIGEAVGLVSPSSVAYQLRELERKGYLRRDPHRPRALVLTEPELRRLCPECGGSGRLAETIGEAA